MRGTRTGAGIGVSTTIELRRLDPVSAAAIAVRTLTANETYKSTTVGEGIYQFSRVYRPRWATISGWFFTIALLGAGYWLLLIKRTEACTMWVNEDRATVRVILTGGLLPEVFEQLCGAFDAAEDTVGPSTAVNESERTTFDRKDDVLPARTFRSQPVTKPVVIDLNAHEREDGDLRADLTSAIGDAAVLDLPAVRFENGEEVRVMGVVYVGRDPMQTDASGKVVERFVVSDPTGTVAKTHFAMGASLTGLWVEDLYSANGTSVGVDASSARRVRPLERIAVAINERIFFGDLSAVVLPVGDHAGQRV